MPTPPPFHVRPMTTADTPEVVALARSIDPADWVPEDLDRWLDTGGGYVAELPGGRIMAMFHLEVSRPGEAYFSGMRVAPDLQGRGYGTAFGRIQLDLAHARGCDTVWLLSEQGNLWAHRTVERIGFRCVGPWEITGNPVPAAPAPPLPVVPAAAAAVAEWLAAHPPEGIRAVTTAPAGAWHVMSLQGPADLLRARAFTVPGAGLMACEPGDPRDGWIVRWLEGSPGAVAALLARARALAGSGGLLAALPGPQAEALRPLLGGREWVYRAYAFRYDRKGM